MTVKTISLWQVGGIGLIGFSVHLQGVPNYKAHIGSLKNYGESGPPFEGL